MNKTTKSRSFVGELLGKIAPQIGATVVMEPQWHTAGQIIFKGGRKRYFRYSTLDLNPVGASDIAKDKDYANFFMRRMGYPTVPGRAFFSKHWSRAIRSPRDIDAAYSYALEIGLPVFVKPNSGSQGICVSKVHTKREFYSALRSIFKGDRVVLVQKPISGTDCRIVVLDDNVISAYERRPLNVLGNGKSTVRGLLIHKQTRFRTTGRDTIIRPNDERIISNLGRQALTMRSVLPRGMRVNLLDNANLSTGGDALDVTNVIHQDFKRIAIRLTRDMGLRFCGVDLLVHGDIKNKADRFYVLEVNAAPGLDHYAKTGKVQQRIVERMYLEVLKALE